MFSSRPPRGAQTIDPGLIGFAAMAEAPPGRLGLPRQRRIKQARDFARAKTEGKRATNGCLIANWLVRPAGSGSKQSH